MYDFTKKTMPEKKQGEVEPGTYLAVIHGAWINTSQAGNKYIKVDFEIIENGGTPTNKPVPAFFDLRSDDRLFRLGKKVGLNRDYGDDLEAVLRDLRGKEVIIDVVPKIKNGKTFYNASNFRAVQAA